MKLHLPSSLLHTLIACYVSSFVLTGTSFAEATDIATYTTHQDGSLDILGKSVVCFENIQYENAGAAICQAGREISNLSLNDNVLFIENTASSPSYGASYGGAIYNYGTFTLSKNGDVNLRGNKSNCGGAIDNGGTFTLLDNSKITFCENSGSSSGGAITNSGIFMLSGNGDVSFYGNKSDNGGAIYNEWGNFTLSGNGTVTFSGNEGYYNSAIYSYDSIFSVSANGNVLFEKNVGASNGHYCLRSIYSVGGTLNLSAMENKYILFKDSLYFKDSLSANGKVNLNQDGSGDIIFTGSSTEADLREAKGGVDGTAEEILNSRTSEIVTNAKLYGGRLIVEDGAILKGQGITVMENANATIRLNNATLDETGYTIAVSSGSGLEFEGENTLKAASVQLADGATLSFVMGDGNGTDWDAQLVTGQLNVQVSGDLFNEHRLLTLHDGSQYDTSLWTSDAVTVSGTTFDSLSWNAGVLLYTPHVIEAEEDGDLDDRLPDNGNAIIDGNGHSLTVKNAVQLVQMALKNGTVKLEGENNGIVSVTLTEGGELVLTAGAGLKTGDIISMVASGKGELVISGDITLDEHGMKGKNGQKATVSNMSATTTGDAVFENVAFSDSLLDIGAGTTATFKNAVLGAGTRVTDAPATAKFENTLALLDSTNTEVVTESTSAAALQLYMSGDTANAVTLDAGATLVDLTCTVFDTITLSGSDLYLDLTALAVTLGDADAFSLTFTNGTLAAIDTDSLRIYATLDGEHYLAGYTTQQGGMAEKVYFTTSASVPEPATATLSLLALAALAARRRRK